MKLSDVDRLAEISNARNHAREVQWTIDRAEGKRLTPRIVGAYHAPSHSDWRPRSRPAMRGTGIGRIACLATGNHKETRGLREIDRRYVRR